MPDHALPPQATQEYRPEPTPSPPSDRVRVALVGGAGSGSTDDLYPLLRRRLLILTTIAALLS